MENTHSQSSAPPSDLPGRESNRSNRELLPFESNPWKENHGNLLLGFTAMVCLIGASILACRQTRFVPPRFPTKLSDTERNSSSLDMAENATDDGVKLRSVEVRIHGAGSDDGTMRIAIYTNPEGFNDPSKALDTATWKITDGVCVGRLEMPFELKSLAIAAYHDVNGNSELDKNAIGIPSERYGYSNNARGVTGPPTFKDSVVTLGDQPIDISIR